MKINYWKHTFSFLLIGSNNLFGSGLRYTGSDPREQKPGPDLNSHIFSLSLSHICDNSCRKTIQIFLLLTCSSYIEEKKFVFSDLRIIFNPSVKTTKIIWYNIIVSLSMVRPNPSFFFQNRIRPKYPDQKYPTKIREFGEVLRARNLIV